MDEAKLRQTRGIFDRLCAYFDKDGWTYEKHEEDEECLVVSTGATGEDLPMRFVIKIDANREIIMVLSYLPFAIDKARRVEGAIAACMINDKLIDGCFDYDIKTGDIGFRLTDSWKDSGDAVNDDFFRYMIDCTGSTVDEFNDKLLMLSKGVLSVDEFYNLLNEDD